MNDHHKFIHPKKLHIFSVVSELRNITHAAQKLFLSQPAVSNTLLSLEQLFDTKLYEVVGKEIVVTSSGQRLLKHWAQLESCYQQLFDEMNEIKNAEQGDISIAMISTAKYFMLSLIKNFSKDYPKLNFHCQIFDRNQIIENLLSHQFSLGVMTEPPHHHALTSIQLGENPLVLICSPEHEFSGQSNILFENLSKQKFITREYSAQITQNLYRLFEQHQATPQVSLSINSTEAIKEAVIENLGIALLPYLSVARELESKKIIKIDFDTRSLNNNWYIILLKNKILDKATKNFIERYAGILKDHANIGLV
jgi:LysR family transcriptional regulator, low CO2-responsive transcriptional regulator